MTAVPQVSRDPKPYISSHAQKIARSQRLRRSYLPATLFAADCDGSIGGSDLVILKKRFGWKSDLSAAVELYEAKATEVDLVMLDLSMPVMDGARASERLRAFDPDVTVLICSGHFEDERVEAIMKSGAVGHLQKPYTKRTLSSLLDDAMRSRGAGA